MRGLVTPVRRVGALVAVSAVLLAGCKVDARVDITLRSDGSGTVAAQVVLDASAVRRVRAGSALDRAVPLSDARAAGWSVSKWTPVTGGGDELTLTHGFAGQADLARVLAQLAGPNGAVRGPLITRSRSWFSAQESIAVTVDLRRLSAGVRSDAELSRRVTAAGVDVRALDAQLRSELGSAFTLTVAVHAPGGHVDTAHLRADDHALVAASSSQTYMERIVLLAVGVALLVGALLLTAAARVATSRRRRAS